MQDFNGKTAVITGGASGIGLGLAEHCAQLGMNVVLGDIQKDALDQAVVQVEQRQASVIGVVTDTMVKTSVQNLLDEASEAFGNVHLVFNNAGVAAGNSAGIPVWEVPDADWQWVMGVNFYGVLYGVQTFIPHMLAHGEESYIVNTASLAAVMPMGGSYGVSKHGVLALTEGVQTELEQQGANVRAGVLCPGFVDTQIFAAERNRPGAEQGQVNSDDPQFEAAKAMLANGKSPAEIAEYVFQAMMAKQFYMLPHPAWDDFVRSRTEQILARQGVATMDLMAMLERSAAGEQF
jgi:NAD(P)-dependent dehydrogenase (short-subunit alcohol dehydrogenase family)